MTEHREDESDAGDNRPVRTRLIIDTDDVINAAAQLRASKESVAQRKRVTKSEVINAILRGGMTPLTEEISEVERYHGTIKPSKRKKPPGS